jgi:lipid II:glycine glycyltransferase (peptidoglycan interpeptide bridge formation enzyme)
MKNDSITKKPPLNERGLGDFFIEKLNYQAIHQSKEWMDFQENIGRTVFQISNIVIIKISLPFGLSWFWIAKASFKDKESELKQILNELIKLAKKENAIFIRFENPNKNLSEKFKNAIKSYLPEWTLVLDLNLSEDDLLKQMKPKGRYNIRLAQKHKLEIEKFDYMNKNLDKAISAFHKILKETEKRDGFSGHTENVYKKMLKNLKNKAVLYLAKYENQYIAGIIITKSGETATYYYGASSNTHRNVMAPYLLQWQAICDAKKEGFSIYDFMGIAPINIQKHPLSKVTDFKLKFGGIKIQYPSSKDYVVKPFWYLLLKLKNKLKA